MRAVVLREFGAPGNLRLEEVEDPRPGPGQVRIATRAAGVHLIDTKLRAGVQMGAVPLPALPAIPGREVAGAVDTLGDGVDRTWLGRRVVAHLGPASAGYAELAVREVDAIHALPDGLAEDAAVAMIGTGRTAMAILDAAAIAPGDRVLVLAAAGGLGSLLVQAARAAGATVIGAAGGPEKVAHVQALGAERAVDYRVAGWSEDVGEVTVALDGVGGELGRAALELLAPGGRLILYGRASGELTPLSAGDLFRRGITASAAIGPRVRDTRALEERALAAAAAGELVPTLQRFPLGDAAAAHAALEGRATTGKVVLIP
jgi:NADPH2:quinone reductase